jgi:hypothetical protein
VNLTSALFNAAALGFSLAAVLVAVLSGRRQASDVRRSNLLLYMIDMGARRWTPGFIEARDFVMTRLSEHDPAVGISGLPTPARDCVFEVGGFYQDIGSLVVNGVVDEDFVIAMHYTGIKDIWRALEPYIYAEREHLRERGAGSLFGSFEHLAVYVETVPADEVIGAVADRLHRRKFPLPATAEPASSSGANAGQVM